MRNQLGLYSALLGEILIYFVFVVSVHRYYESRRRLFNDSQPARLPKVKQVQNATHKRLMRKKVFRYCMLYSGEYCVSQLYTDRLKVVKSEKERDLWSSINFNFMTDESEHENDGGGTTIVKYLLPWRSKSVLLHFKTKHVPTM